METEEDFKVNEEVINKETGQVMMITELGATYDVDNKKNIPNNRAICTWFEKDIDHNLIGDFSFSELEKIQSDKKE